MRDHFGRLFLHVVRRQPVVVGSDIGLEKGPGAARKQAQEMDLVRLQFTLLVTSRLADLPGEHR